MNHKDVLDKELNIGDTVVFAYRMYKDSATELKKGKVVGFTPQNVRLIFYKDKFSTESEKLVFPSKIAKV